MTNQAKTPAEIAKMRTSGRMLATVLDLLVSKTKAGSVSRDLAQLAAEELRALGGQPAFLNVLDPSGKHPFPDVICISISEEVQHGIPSERVIRDGDVVNFDFGVNYGGMITDAGLTIAVGRADSDTSRLLTGTRKALYAGLKQVKAGAKVSSISRAIQKTLLAHDLGIVRELVGHGVGHHLHEEPEIPNYVSDMPDYTLKANQTVAIEPIATLGSGAIRMADDHWTLLSSDDTLAAHFEHTILVTDSGYEILTTLNK